MNRQCKQHPRNRQALPAGRTLNRSIWITTCLLLLLVACTPALPYRARGKAVRTYPHARDAFTQGLVFDGPTLYESTGLYGQSTLRRVELETGEVLQMERLPAEYFAEGCTVWDEQIIQLTWKAGVGFVYDKESFALEDEFTYSGEGWGLTQDGRQLIMSDGSSYLRFLDPETFEETGRIQVVDKGRPVEQLNELESMRGEVWANIWQTPEIVRIDAATGDVLGWVDFSDLVETEPRGVLNGIAVRGRTVFVTGKQWESIYQVEVRPADTN